MKEFKLLEKRKQENAELKRVEQEKLLRQNRDELTKHLRITNSDDDKKLPNEIPKSSDLTLKSKNTSSYNNSDYSPNNESSEFPTNLNK